MKTLLASLIATVVLSGAAACAHAQTPASGAQLPSTTGLSAQANHNRRLEGLWDEHVTLINCSSGAPMVTFRATNLFGADGSLTAVNSNPPALSGPTLGTWWRVSRHGDFGAKMRFFRFNPDGSFAGVQQVTRALEVDPDGENLHGTVDVEIFDVNDNLIQTACATEVGVRISG
ncbi:MAG: hypothetical protein ACREPX_14810 [Rhodanobacteraceae bacterium]